MGVILVKANKHKLSHLEKSEFHKLDLLEGEPAILCFVYQHSRIDNEPLLFVEDDANFKESDEIQMIPFLVDNILSKEAMEEFELENKVLFETVEELFEAYKGKMKAIYAQEYETAGNFRDREKELQEKLN